MASRCYFEITYGCGQTIIRFKLIAVLADADIKQDILSQSDMNPQETVKAVEGKKCGKVAKMKVGAQDTRVSKKDNPYSSTKKISCKNCKLVG